jgi:hypothetical protein
MGNSHAKAAAAACLAALLAACGGGGGGDTAAEAPGVVPTASALSAWIVPASLPAFDLSGFKLTLPVDRYGGTGGIDGTQYAAVTLNSTQLVAGYADASFHADKQGRVVFTAPANGAVTTPGSGTDHTRSELREFHRGAGSDADGYWVGSGVLRAQCAVQAVAASATRAFVGQVRSADFILALLAYRPATRDVAIDVYQSPVAGSAHASTVLATNVAPGDAIAYEFSVDHGALQVSVNGTTRSFTVDAAWAATPVAFKLGAYHNAPSTGNAAGDATAVAFTRWNITH